MDTLNKEIKIIKNIILTFSMIMHDKPNTILLFLHVLQKY